MTTRLSSARVHTVVASLVLAAAIFTAPGVPIAHAGGTDVVVELDRLDEIDLAPLAGRGLRMTPAEIRTLAGALVRFEGVPGIPFANGVFVSSDGLILAPYDVARPCLDATGERAAALRATGFHTPTRDGELACPGIELAYDAEIENEPAAEGTAAPPTRRVTRKSAGGVKLVHVPDESIARFGGPGASRHWPSYALPYAFLRAYGRDGKPVVPPQWVQPARFGYRGGAMVLGLGDGEHGPWLSIGAADGFRPHGDAPRLPYATTLSELVACVADDDGHRVSEEAFAQLSGSRIPDFSDPLLGDVPLAFAIDLARPDEAPGAMVVDGTGRLLGLVSGQTRAPCVIGGAKTECRRTIALDVRAALDLAVRLYVAIELIPELGL